MHLRHWRKWKYPCTVSVTVYVDEPSLTVDGGPLEIIATRMARIMTDIARVNSWTPQREARTLLCQGRWECFSLYILGNLCLQIIERQWKTQRIIKEKNEVTHTTIADMNFGMMGVIRPQLWLTFSSGVMKQLKGRRAWDRG